MIFIHVMKWDNSGWNLSIMNQKWMFMINVFHNDVND